MATPASIMILRIINALWCIIVIGYVAYGWYAYVGVYRVFAEWQISTFGSYRVLLTALLPILVLMLPSLGIGVMLQRARGRPQAAGVADPRRNLRMIALAGVAALVVAAGAGALGYVESSKVPTVATFDLRQTTALPTTDHFVVTGMARTDLMVGLETESRGTKSTYSYVPLTAPDWQRGQPLTYFLKTNQTAYLPPGGGRTFRLARNQPPFLLTTQPAVVESHALPGPVREAYRNNNIALAPQLHIFSQNLSEELYLYWAIAGVGALVGVICLLAAGMLALRLRRRATSESSDQRTDDHSHNRFMVSLSNHEAVSHDGPCDAFMVRHGEREAFTGAHHQGE